MTRNETPMTKLAPNMGPVDLTLSYLPMFITWCPVGVTCGNCSEPAERGQEVKVCLYLGQFLMCMMDCPWFLGTIYNTKPRLWERSSSKNDLPVMFHGVIAACCGISFGWRWPILMVRLTYDWFPFYERNFHNLSSVCLCHRLTWPLATVQDVYQLESYQFSLEII